MATIKRQEWVGNNGFYEFDRGYLGFIAVNMYPPEFSYLSSVGVCLLHLPNSRKTFEAVDRNPVTNLEDGRKRGEELLLRLVSDFES